MTIIIYRSLPFFSAFHLGLIPASARSVRRPQGPKRFAHAASLQHLLQEQAALRLLGRPIPGHLREDARHAQREVRRQRFADPAGATHHQISSTAQGCSQIHGEAGEPIGRQCTVSRMMK